MLRQSRFKVFLAGRVAFESDGVVIDEARFPGRQGRLLFAYLVAEQGRPVPRDELADALWGETPPSTSDKALSVLASKLRNLLGDGGIDGGTALTSAFGSYRLNLPEGTWVDTIAAADAVREAEAALATDDFEQAKAAAMEAASLARPTFLPGEEGAWVDGKRRELTDILRRALSCVAEASLRSGDTAGAANYAEETIALEPYRETGYRQLMSAHAAAGNRAEALRVYERCRQLLAAELGTYPSPETESIYRELLEVPTPEPGAAAAPETAPVAVAERGPPGGESPAPTTAPRSLWRRRRVAVGVLAGLAAAVVIPLFALGGGEHRANPANATNSVGVLDEGSGAVEAAFKLPAAPTAVATGLGYVWAASAESNAVFAIKPATKTVYRIGVGNAPAGIAVGDRYVWVTNSLTRTVSQIDPRAQIELQKISVGNGPTGVAVGGGHLWVANTLDHTVSKIRTRDAKRVATYGAGPDPGAIAVGENAVWIASKSDDTVVKLNPRNGQLLNTISVGHGPAAIALGLGSVWVANSDGTVTQINPTLESVVHSQKVGANLSGIAVVGDEVWATNERAGTVSRIKPANRWRTNGTPVGGRPAGLAGGVGRAYVALRPTGETHRGGTLTVALDSVEPLETLDLAVGSLNIVLWRFAGLTNDGLLAYRSVGGQAGSEVVPDLARSMQMSRDGKTYTFQLRPHIRYSNGRPLRATDFRYAIERGFKLRRRTDPNTDYLSAADVFSGIRGANQCTGSRCHLAAGIVANDGERTVAFHLVAPDPYFRYKLASTFAVPVPAGTSLREATRRPPPSTGPYRIANVTNDSVRLERNPYFREWSATVRPDGFPNEIVLKSASTKAGIALVEKGKADLTSNFPLEPFSVAPTFRPQLKPHPLAGTVYLVLDPTRPPFNDLRARRALNYALDRNKVAQLTTEGSRPTCQVLPPNFPGYRPYCPYTGPNTEGAWTAPDLTRAARLVAASGTRGAPVTLWVDRDFVVNVQVGRYLKRLLERLGYRPRIRESFPGTPRTYFVALERGAMSQLNGPQVAFAAWTPDYPSASSFIQELFACQSKFNYSRFCDPKLERTIKRAVQLEQTDRGGANRLWAQVDREITDRALWVPLFNGYQADLVSKRVGNYEYNPQYGALLSQLWVR